MIHPELPRIATETGYKNLKSMHFLYHLVKNINPDCVLELGTWLGASAGYMASAIKEDGRIVSIDNYKQHRELEVPIDVPELNLSMCGLLDKVILIEGDTFEVSRLLAEFPLHPEIIFMDASHTAEAMKKEYDSFSSILPDNHVIVFDDYFSPVEPFVTSIKSRYKFCVIVEDFHQGIAVVGTNVDYLTKVNDAILKARNGDVL